MVEPSFEIITIYNYPRENVNYAKMLKVWAMQAVAAMRESGGRVTRVRIISMEDGMDRDLQTELETTHSAKELQFEVNDECGRPPPRTLCPNSYHAWHLAVYKLFVLCNRKMPFLFFDIDAIIIAPSRVGELFDACSEKPIVAIDHQRIVGHTAQFNFKFANTGVLAVSNPRSLDYETISKVPIARWCPGGQDDQVRFNNHFWGTRYDYTSPRLNGAGWNSCGAFKRSLANGATVSQRPDGLGFEVSTVTAGLPSAEENDVPVRVLHYWYRYKPWFEKCDIYEALESGLPTADTSALLEIGTVIADPDDLLVNTSVKDGSDSFDQYLPIGVGWKYATLTSEEQKEILAVPRKSISARRTLLYVGFDVTTDRYRRGDRRCQIAKTLAANGFANVGASLPFKNYMEELRDSAFVVSPEGNGIDCHRHYEAWLAGAVPILEYNPLMAKKIAGLPIVWTYDAYADITRERLMFELQNILTLWRHGTYLERIKTVLRPSSYPLEQQKKIQDRSNYWVRRLAKLPPNTKLTFLHKIDLNIDYRENGSPVGKPVAKMNPLLGTLNPSPIHKVALDSSKLLLDGRKLSPYERGRMASVSMAHRALSESFKDDPAMDDFKMASVIAQTSDGDGPIFVDSVEREVECDPDLSLKFEAGELIVGSVAYELGLEVFRAASDERRFLPLKVAVVGVGRGGYVNNLLNYFKDSCLGAKVVGVDPYLAAYDGTVCDQDQMTLDNMYLWVRGRTKQHSPTFSLVRMRSQDFAELVDDHYFDVVHFSRHRQYAVLRAEISAWRHKVRPGGVLIFEDYANPDFPGVKAAVAELVAELGCEPPPETSPTFVKLP